MRIDPLENGPALKVPAAVPARPQARSHYGACLFEAVSDGVFVTDAQGRIVDANATLLSFTGLQLEQLLGQEPTLLLSEPCPPEALELLQGRGAQGSGWSGEVCCRGAEGRLATCSLQLTAVAGADGRFPHVLALLRNLAQQECQQEVLQRVANFDLLTGLPNRSLALQRLAVAIESAGPDGRRVAVCQLDIDGFARVNERVGRARADALLAGMGGRLQAALRGSGFLARLEGDQFVLLLNELPDMAALHAALRRIRDALAPPFTVGADSVRLTACIGVALYPVHGLSPKPLLRAADQAVARAKAQGAGSTWMPDAEAAPRASSQDGLLDELRVALAAGQLCLYYQPKVCARSGVPLGAEALLRWQHPQRGLLAPGDFLPVVAGTPLETPLDLWVIATAAAQLRHWQRKGWPLRLGVNVSPGTLTLPELADTVAGIVHAGGHPPAAGPAGIELEVVETAALADLEAAARNIEACARQGIRFALDDFGTGYSSLSYLRRLPVSTLKIDRSFVSGMLTDPGDLHIVRAVIGLAEAFGVNTVAEGVETAEHARWLADLGCRQLQGYGIARPMPAARFEDWLAQRLPGAG